MAVDYCDPTFFFDQFKHMSIFFLAVDVAAAVAAAAVVAAVVAAVAASGNIPLFALRPPRSFDLQEAIERFFVLLRDDIDLRLCLQQMPVSFIAHTVVADCP